MKNKEWLKQLTELHNSESTPEIAKQGLAELEQMLEKAITKKKKQPESDWDRIQKAKAFNQQNNITGHIRDFDFKTYLQNDKQAKDIFTKYLQNKAYTIDSIEETYGSDVIASKDGESVRFELEISQMDFNKDNWPFMFVHFLGRKERYYKEEGDFHYVLISKNGQYALTAKASDIFKKENYRTKECSRNGINGVDEFFELPKDQVKFFKL